MGFKEFMKNESAFSEDAFEREAAAIFSLGTHVIKVLESGQELSREVVEASLVETLLNADSESDECQVAFLVFKYLVHRFPSRED